MGLTVHKCLISCATNSGEGERGGWSWEGGKHVQSWSLLEFAVGPSLPLASGSEDIFSK